MAVVALGLVATVAAALLSTTKPIGSTELEWGTRQELPPSASAAIPGGGSMRIGHAEIRTTEPNGGGYRLYRVSGVLVLSQGAAVGRARASCRVRVPPTASIAHTPNKRASYPRPSEELIDQPVPNRVVVEFGNHGGELAAVQIDDAFAVFADEPGVKVEWATYRQSREEWDWGLPPGRPQRPLRLGFASVWRTPGTPSARTACTVTTGSGEATVRTAGSYGG